jgi:hypothetical protein
VAIPTTPLGKIAANGKLVPAQPPPDTKSKLAQVIGGRRGEDATLPVIGPVWMELLGSAKSTEIAAAADREIAELGFTDGSAGAAIRFEAARALRTLAAGVRDPADHGKAFGTLDEWRDLVDDQLLNACWQAYGEMQERLDPLERPLTEEEFGAIEAAVKKKDGAVLRSFGIARLCAWLVSTADPPAISPTPSSSSSDSSSAPSP